MAICGLPLSMGWCVTTARFEVFNKANSKGINSNRFDSLYEDLDGTLWISTEDGGLTALRGWPFQDLHRRRWIAGKRCLCRTAHFRRRAASRHNAVAWRCVRVNGSSPFQPMTATLLHVWRFGDRPATLGIAPARRCNALGAAR